MRGCTCPAAGICFFLSCFAVVWAQDPPRRTAGESPYDGGAFVVCEPRDPYYPLALEISRIESIPCYQTIGEALALGPRFLLWGRLPCIFYRQGPGSVGIDAERETFGHQYRHHLGFDPRGCSFDYPVPWAS